MKLIDLIACYGGAVTYDKAFDTLEIAGASSNSKKVKQNYIFFALTGAKTNGSYFINEAIANGASLLVACYSTSLDVSKYKNVLLTDDPNDLLSYIAYYLIADIIPNKILCATGSNGKTSALFFVSQILTLLNYSNISIGSLGVYVNAQKQVGCSSLVDLDGETNVKSYLTTPLAEDIAHFITQFSPKKLDYLILEASSHGIAKKRIAHLGFNVAGFTNLQTDHLDFHKDMQSYFDVKAALFTNYLKGVAVVNADDPWGKILIDRCQSNNITYLDYGRSASSVKIISIGKKGSGQQVHIRYDNHSYEFHVPLIGEIQVYNVLCALTMLLAEGLDIDYIIPTISELKPVNGRLELVCTLSGNRRIFIDYGHNDDAMHGVLSALYNEDYNKLRIVFGAGGDRDKLKRPKMGAVAHRFADVIYVTNDNSRTEDSQAIRKQIIDGFPDFKKTFYNIDCRRQAIKKAVLHMEQDDILLLLGMGIHYYEMDGQFGTDESFLLDIVEGINQGVLNEI